MTTKRVHLHRIRHRPEFLAEALKAPLGPSPFAPFCLLAAFESEWTLVLSCKCPRLVSNPPLRFYMVTSKRGRLRSEMGCQFGVRRHGSVLGIDWSPRDRRN